MIMEMSNGMRVNYKKHQTIKIWRNFEKVIDKAIVSAKNSISNREDWVVEVNKPIKTGKGKEEIIKDYKLSRYICYLIVQNADSSKEVVALGQTYFAIQTRNLVQDK